MTRLEQTRDKVATTPDTGSTPLQDYRLGAEKTQVEKKIQAPTATSSPDVTGYTDAGSSSTNEIINHWKPDHGQGKLGTAWFKALKLQESESVAGNYYTAKDGDCLESIARRQLRSENHAIDNKSTKAGVEQLIALNKDHYKSLTTNEHYIQKGWTLKLSPADVASAEAVPPAAKLKDTPPPAAVPDTSADNKALPPAPAEADNKGAKDAPPPAKPAPDAKAPDAKSPEKLPSDKPPAPGTPGAATANDHAPHKAAGVMDRLSSYGKEAYDEGKQLTHDHPWLLPAGAVIGTAALLALSRGKISKLFGAEKELSATGQSIEREAVLAKVGPIPDVERPQLATALYDAPKEFEGAANDYRSSLFQLRHQLPTHYTIGELETVPALAKRVLEGRAPITGERISAEAIDAEATRIFGLNPNINNLEGEQHLLIHDEAAISKLGDITRFKHVPQIGQLLKQHGVSEENVQEAFRIQNSLPKENRPLIGQVLVDAKLATKPQVDDAFEQQNSLKALLKDVHTEVFGN